MDQHELLFTGVLDLPNETGQPRRCLRTRQPLDASLEIRPHRHTRHARACSRGSHVIGGLRPGMDVQPNPDEQDRGWAYLPETRAEPVEGHGQEGCADAVRRFLRQPP